MSGGALTLATGVQGGHEAAPDTPVVLALIVVLVLASVAAWRVQRRRRLPRRVSDEWAARAIMGELCPHGWQARVTLYGAGAQVPPDAPPARTPLVELEWRRYAAERGRVAASGRCWAPNVAEALQVMVDSSRADLALGGGEHSVADGEEEWWPS